MGFRGGVLFGACLVQVGDEVGDLLVFVFALLRPGGFDGGVAFVGQGDASAQQAPASRAACSSSADGVAATCPPAAKGKNRTPSCNT